MDDARAVDRAAELRGAVEAFVSRRVDAAAVEDVVQDVFVRLARGDRSGAPDDLRAWVYAVARSAIADHHRRRGARSRLEDAARREGADPALEAADEASPARELLAAWLTAQIEALPPIYAETLALTEVEGRGHAEVAERLGVARGTVKARVSRGRQLLRERLDDCCRVELDARNRPVALEPRLGCCRD